MKYNSKYKKLIVSGCSFTHNNHHTPCSWPNTLAVWGNMSIENLAIPGAGNAHIKNSTILHLEKTRPDPETTLIMIMWSGPERIDWITDRNSSKFYTQYPFSYNYTSQNELTLGGSWWVNKIKTHLDDVIVNYSKYQSNSSLALTSWLLIQDLENYLKVNGYTYYFMSWFDYNDPVDNKNRWIEFDNELIKLGLKRDLHHWLLTETELSLGRWTATRPEYLMEDGIHAVFQGHEAWLQAVIVPKLIEKNVLNEDTTQ